MTNQFHILIRALKKLMENRKDITHKCLQFRATQTDAKSQKITCLLDYRYKKVLGNHSYKNQNLRFDCLSVRDIISCTA